MPLIKGTLSYALQSDGRSVYLHFAYITLLLAEPGVPYLYAQMHHITNETLTHTLIPPHITPLRMTRLGPS
jgi:hypothetical protein